MLLSNESNENSSISESVCIPVAYLRQYLNDWTQIGYVQGLFTVVYVITFILGVLGNSGLLFSLLSTGKNPKRAANLFLANLAFAELLLCLTTLPVTPAHVFKPDWTWSGSEGFCKALPMIQVVVVLESSLTLCLIAVDRYWNIVKIGSRPLSLKSAVSQMSVTWVVAFCAGIPETWFNVVSSRSGVRNFTLCEPQCSAAKMDRTVYGTFLLVTQFAVPLAIMAVCYYRVLVKVQKDLMTYQHAQASFQAKAVVRRKRVIRTLILMVLAFVLSWFPLSIVNWLADFGVSPLFLRNQGFFVQIIFHLIAMSSVFWIPLLYFWLSSSRMKDLKKSIKYIGEKQKKRKVKRSVSLTLGKAADGPAQFMTGTVSECRGGYLDSMEHTDTVSLGESPALCPQRKKSRNFISIFPDPFSDCDTFDAAETHKKSSSPDLLNRFLLNEVISERLSVPVARFVRGRKPKFLRRETTSDSHSEMKSLSRKRTPDSEETSPVIVIVRQPSIL